MKRLRLRFSLKAMLAAVTIVAAVSFLLVQPTFRARRFVSLIDAGQLDSAEAMLPTSINDASPHRRTVQRAIGAAIEPLTIEQLWRGERNVIVTEARAEFTDGTKTELAAESESAGFVVGRTTISSGWHSFYQW